MAHRFATVSALAPAALVAIVASADAETIDWKTVGGWDISFYPGSAGCQAFAQFEEGTAFFIGFDNSNDVLALDVTLLDRRWASIEQSKQYEIEVKFGNETPWTLNMDGVVMEDFPGLNIMIDAGSDEASLFVDEFQRKTAMSWSYGGSTLGRYTLRGSRRAFDEVLACQRSYLEAMSSTADPFATGDPSDPFAE